MKPRFTLQPNETLEKEFQTTVLVWLSRFIFSTICILSVFFFMVRLFREGAVGISIFALLFVVGTFVGGRAWVKFSRTRLIITSERVIAIRQNGFFDFTFREIPLHAIESISFRRKGFFPSMFRYGKLKIETKGESGRLVFDALPRPDQIQDLLYGFIHEEKTYEKS